MKMAISKETNKPVSGLGGVMGVTSSFGQKLSTAGHYKKDLHIVDVDTSRMDGVGDYVVIPKTEPGEFKVTETHGTNWNKEARYALNTPAGRFSIGSLSECPEDANLERDLSFAYDVVDMMRAAYEAGLRGDKFVVESVDEDEE
ncbi:hypothetical protein ACS2BX_25775 [Bacillus cereus group sp. BceL300]|uniref:hypothetical protein n=1 Tax=Bacillus cereus group sp. BceL300 TaxID=3444985 RepID=UPI003F210350